MKMMSAKVGPQLEDCIATAYRAGRPVLLIGGTGIGKSESLIDCAKALNIGCIVRDLSLMEPVELCGIPIIDECRRMSYAIPAFLPISGSGLLVFEEVNRAPEYVRVPLFQLLTARTLNDYTLPPGWLPVAAMNPPGTYHTDELDRALLARFVKVNVVADPRQWLEWAATHKIHEKVCRFVEATPKIFEPLESNPRAWKYVSDLLWEYEARPTSKNTLALLIHGTIGHELGHAFLTYYLSPNAETPPPPEEILDRYELHAKKVRDWSARGNTAVLESLCTQLLIYLQGAAIRNRLAKDSIATKNLASLCADLPAEFRARLGRHLASIRKK